MASAAPLPVLPRAALLAPCGTLPWASWAEWVAVMDATWAGDGGRLLWALGVMRSWRQRCRVPACVEATEMLLSNAVRDNGQAHDETALRLAGCMAISRAVNGVVDTAGGRSSQRSVASVAAKLGIPRAAVDVRHESTHQLLPTLPSLRLARTSMLEWLQRGYWHAQYEALDAEIGRCAAAILPALQALSTEVRAADDCSDIETPMTSPQVAFNAPCSSGPSASRSSGSRKRRRDSSAPAGACGPRESLQASNFSPRKDSDVLPVHVLTLASLPGTPEHAHVFACSSSSLRGKAALTKDAELAPTALASLTTSGGGKRAQAAPLPRVAVVLNPHTTSPALALGAVFIPFLLTGKVQCPADLGTVGVSPPPPVHAADAFLHGVAAAQAGASPRAARVSREAAVATGPLLSASPAAWLPVLHDLQKRLPALAPTLWCWAVCGQVQGVDCLPWLRLLMSRHWHALVRHELGLVQTGAPRSAPPPPRLSIAGEGRWVQALLRQEWPADIAQVMADPAPLQALQQQHGPALLASLLLQAPAKDERQLEDVHVVGHGGGAIPWQWTLHTCGAAAHSKAGAAAVLQLLGEAGLSPGLATHAWWKSPIQPRGASTKRVAFVQEGASGAAQGVDVPSPIPRAAAAAASTPRSHAAAASRAPLTPAFDSTVVLSLADIEGLLGMSRSESREAHQPGDKPEVAGSPDSGEPPGTLFEATGPAGLNATVGEVHSPEPPYSGPPRWTACVASTSVSDAVCLGLTITGSN